jgi:hypothetical protein
LYVADHILEKGKKKKAGVGEEGGEGGVDVAALRIIDSMLIVELYVGLIADVG